MEQKDRDTLIEIRTDVQWIKNLLTGHIAHHKKLFFAGLGVVGSFVLAMVLMALRG